MEDKKLKVYGNLVVMTWLNKDGIEIRALGIDLGYTVKLLTFKAQDIAEVMNLTVIDFVKLTPVVQGTRSKYPVEV